MRSWTISTLYFRLQIFYEKQKKIKQNLTHAEERKNEHLDTDLMISRENTEGALAEHNVYASSILKVYISLPVFMFYSLLNQSLALLGLNLLGKPLNLLWFIS